MALWMRSCGILAVAFLALISSSRAALIDPTRFAPPGDTFKTPLMISYGNVTRDVCYIRDVAMAASPPNFADAMQVYLNGSFAYRLLNATTGELSPRKRTIYGFASNRNFAAEDWFQLFASYYKKNASEPFYADWLNATLTCRKPYKVSDKVRAAATKALFMLQPVYYMYHEVGAGYTGLKLENDIEHAIEEITHGFFAFYGPDGAACSAPALFQQAGKAFCTVNNKGVSKHLKSLEDSFVMLVKASALGNSTNGIKAFEAGREQMFRSVAFSSFQLMLQSAQKAVQAAKAKNLDSYRAALAEGRGYFRMVEPFVHTKSRATTRRLISLYNYSTRSMRKSLVAQVKAAMVPYLKAIGAPWSAVWGC